MARKKVLMVRHMPYTTMLNRARMFRAMGWDVSLLHDQPFANSQLLIRAARVFEDIWSVHFLVENADNIHDFIRTKGFDLVYTIGPRDDFNTNFTNCPTAWIHDSRDLMCLIDPQAEDEEKRLELIEEQRLQSNHSQVCINSCDLAVFVTPWQQERAIKMIYGPAGKKDSIWLPNVPFMLPELTPKRKDRDPNVLYWGYTGSMTAAWNNAATWAGNIAAELDKLNQPHEFHYWAFMERHERQSSEWFFWHDTLEQHDMIAEMASWIDYGIVLPPTKSDGINAPTGFPGKLGDYVAADLTTLVPEDFLVRSMLRKHGWGFAYDSPKDAARIMANRRKPQNDRKPALNLQMKEFMDTLDVGVRFAEAAYKKRYVPPVVIQAPRINNLLVASGGNRYHAENHIAPILGADFLDLQDLTGFVKDIRKYKDLYLVGFWPADQGALDLYWDFIRKFERVVLHWAGSDIIVAERHPNRSQILQLLHDPHIRHFAQHKQLADKVANFLSESRGLKEMGYCSVVNTPSRLVFEKEFPMPQKFAISCYYSMLDRSTYCSDLLDEVIALMPDDIFYLHGGQSIGKDNHPPEGLPTNAVWLGSMHESNYPEFLKQVSVFLRMTTHDGVPYSMVEHLCAGRYAIAAHDYPMVTRVGYDAKEIVDVINAHKEKKTPHREGSAYWRMYNDYDRFRTRIAEAFDGCVKRKEPTETIEVVREVEAVG